MKNVLKWLKNKERNHLVMTTIPALLLMLMLASEELHQLWNWWNYSLKLELQAYTSRIRDLATKSADIWVEKSLFLHENTSIESLHSDYRLISWMLNLSLLPELMLWALNLLTQILTQLINPTFWESALMEN